MHARTHARARTLRAWLAGLVSSDASASTANEPVPSMSKNLSVFRSDETAQPAHWMATSTTSQLSRPISLNASWSIMELVALAAAADDANEAAAAGREKAPSVAVLVSSDADMGSLRVCAGGCRLGW
jgi:uncharacterized membrane protein